MRTILGFKKLQIKLLLICFCFFTFVSIALANSRTVRIGYFPLDGFYNIQSDNSVTGYGMEYAKAISSTAGWDTKFVYYPSWPEALKGLGNGDIDLLAPSQYTAERAQQFNFEAFPIGTEYGALMTLSSNSKLVFEDYNNFNNLKVGCVPSIIFFKAFNEYATQNKFSVNFSYYKDTPALVAALNSGEVDAIMTNLMVKTNTMKLLARFGAAPIYFMINKNAEGLVEETNNAINKLFSQRPLFQSTLDKKYFSTMQEAPLSRDEYKYISKLDTVSVGLKSDFKPFSYIDEETKKPDGVTVALLDDISKRTGIKFTYTTIPNNVDPVKYAKENNIVVIADVEQNEETSSNSGLQLTDPYFILSKSFIGLEGTQLTTETKGKIAVPSGTPELMSSWHKYYPNLEFVSYSSLEECIDAVRSNKALAILNSHYSMEDVLAKPKNHDLKILPMQTLRANLSYGLVDEKADSHLVSILNKAISQISDRDKEALLGRYMQKSHSHLTITDFLYLYRLPLIFLALICAICFFFWRRMENAKEKARAAIEANERKLQKITNNINGGVIVLEANQGLKIVYANDGFLDIIGLPREDFDNEVNGSYLAYVHPDDLHIINSAIASKEENLSLELRILRHDGSYIPVLFNCSSDINAVGEKELYCVILDMTEQNKLLEQLRIENQRTELILDRVEEIFYEVNFKDLSLSCSASFQERMGWSLPHSFDPAATDNIEKQWKVLPEDLPLLKDASRKVIQTKEMSACTCRLENASKKYVWCEITQYPIINDDGSIATIIGLIRNVDDVVNEREALKHQTLIDPLTNLYNKEAFEEMVNKILQAHPEQNHALLFIDLDHFKSINDTLGHVVGDKAICEAAEKLRIIFSHYDVISRFGGDEFCILVRNIPEETLRAKLNWLIEKMHTTYKNDSSSTDITCSCGVCCTHSRASIYKDILDKADKALYQSKEAGRDRFTFFEDLNK